MQRMTIEATPITANNVLITSKAGTWELLQTAFQKQTHRNRQPDAAVVTYRHTVGENGPRIQEVLYQQ